MILEYPRLLLHNFKNMHNRKSQAVKFYDIEVNINAITDSAYSTQPPKVDDKDESAKQKATRYTPM